MLSDGQSELTSCLIVRYHSEALDHAPSEIVVIKSQKEDNFQQAKLALEKARNERDELLAEFVIEVSALLTHQPLSSEWQMSEARVIASLQKLDGSIGDKHIPTLRIPVEVIGGPGISPQIVKTIGSIGSQNAFDTVLEVLKKCAGPDRDDQVTANACLEVLEQIDSNRAEKEGVYELMELAYL